MTRSTRWLPLVAVTAAVLLLVPSALAQPAPGTRLYAVLGANRFPGGANTAVGTLTFVSDTQITLDVKVKGTDLRAWTIRVYSRGNCSQVLNWVGTRGTNGQPLLPVMTNGTEAPQALFGADVTRIHAALERGERLALMLAGAGSGGAMNQSPYRTCTSFGTTPPATTSTTTATGTPTSTATTTATTATGTASTTTAPTTATTTTAATTAATGTVTTTAATGTSTTTATTGTTTATTGTTTATTGTTTATTGTVTSTATTGTTATTTAGHPPTVGSFAVTTVEDTPGPITLTATDPDGDATTFDLVAGPGHGSLGPISSPVCPPGTPRTCTATVTYTPDANFNGPDSFTYTANDGSADSASGTVSITVSPVNDAPVGLADSYSTPEDTPLSIAAPGVLGNDTDVEGATLTAVLVSGPSHDSAFTLNADGSFSYTPDLDYDGPDSFSYTANDGALDSNTVTVSITVTDVNATPVAVADSYSVVEDATLSVPAPGVLANDTDADGDPLMAILVTPPADGTLTLNDDGSFTYTPDLNFSGPDSFTYQANDGTVDSSTVTVSLTVTAVNDAPAALDDAYTTDEDTPLGVSQPGVLGNDTDADTDALTAVLVSGPAHGTLTLNPDGSFTYTPAADYNGPDSFTYRANDGTADSNTATVSLTVTSVNEPPVAVADSYSTPEDTALSVAAPGVLGNDTDVDSATLTAVLVSGPSHDSAFTLNADGSFSYTPDANYQGPDSFTYKANDGALDSNTVTVSLTVNAVNDAPVALDDAYTAAEDTPLGISPPGVLGNDSDPDGDPLTAVLVAGPGHGTLTVNPDGGFTYTPAADYNGPDSFTYRGNDGTADSNTATVSITVTAVNDAPVNTVPGAQTVRADLTLTLAGASAIGVADGDAGTNAIEVTLTATNGTLDLSGTSGLSFTTGDGTGDASMVFTGTLTDVNTALDGLVFHPTAVGPASIEITSDDQGNTGSGGALTDTDSVAITVSPANQAPVAASQTGAGAVATNEDAPVLITLSATDADDDPLTFIKVTDPANGTLGAIGAPNCTAANVCTATVTYTPNLNANGPDSFTFKANDGVAGDSNVATVEITVNAVNDEPSFTKGADQTVNEDSGAQTVSGWATAISKGPANESAQIVDFIVSNGNNALFSVQPAISATGTLTYTPAANQNGSATVTVAIHDNGGTANGGDDTSPAQTFTITVNAVNDPPVAGADAFDTIGNTELRVDLAAGTTPTVTETTASGTGVRGNDADPVEGDPFTVTSIVGCADVTPPYDCPVAGGTVSMTADGDFSFIPSPNLATGTPTDTTFQYLVTDTPTLGSPASGTGTVTIHVYDKVWYVRQGASGTGTSANPLGSFTGIAAGDGSDSDAPGDYIFVHNTGTTLNSAITLEANQHLLGEGVGLSINRNLNGNGAPTNLVAAGTKPQVTSSTADTVTIGAAIPIEIRGLSLASTVASNGNAIVLTSAAALTGSPTLTISDNTFTGATAEGIDVNLNVGTTGTLGLTIASNTWTGAAASHAGNAVDISRAAGSLNLAFSSNTGIVSNASGLVVSGGGAVTITAFANNSVSGDTAAAGMSLSNVVFDATPGAPVQQVNGGTLAIGTAANPVGGSGLAIVTSTGNLTFDDLDAFSSSGTALSVSSPGPATALTFGVTPAAPAGVGTSTLLAVNGPAISLTLVTADLRLADLDSTTTTSGFALNTVAGQVSASSDSSISKTSGGGGPAFSVASSTATVTYGGTINVTSGSGISLTTNTGGTMSFTGQLTIATGASPAFAATGGGTLTVSGSANTLGTTTATALNVANTTIGAGGLTFRSISANGASNGIVLNTTGSSGGLTVTGDGGTCTSVATCTGGAIQNTTSDGILLNSTRNLVLQRMLITGADEDGIHGDSVSGLTFRDSIVSGFGNGTASPAGESEDGMDFINLTGAVIIQRSTIGPQQGFTLALSPPIPDNKGIVIRNTNVENLTMTVTGSTFTQIDNDGIDGEVFGSSQAAGSRLNTLTVNGSSADGPNTFSQINGRAITFGSTADNATNGTITLVVNNNTFNTVGIGARWAAQGGTTINAAYKDNTMTGTSNDAIRSLSDPTDQVTFGATTIVNATIEGNNFGGGSAFIAARRGSTTNMLFGGEDATHTGNTNIGGGGIALEANRAGVLNIDVLNNIIFSNVPEPGAVNAAMYVQSANSGGGGSTITAHILGNSFSVDLNDEPIADVVFDNLTSTIRLQGWNGTPANNPSVFITGQNTFPADSTTDVVTSGAVIGFAGDAVPGGGPFPGQ